MIAAVCTRGAHGAQQREPVEVGQHAVKHHRVEAAADRVHQPFAAGSRWPRRRSRSPAAPWRDSPSCRRRDPRSGPCRPARRCRASRPSWLIASPVICPAWPASVSRATARSTFQTITRLSSPAVTAVRPSALNAARTTAPSWRPEAVRTLPVARSRKRTEPSRPPSSSVRSSGLRAVCVGAGAASRLRAGAGSGRRGPSSGHLRGSSRRAHRS